MTYSLTTTLGTYDAFLSSAPAVFLGSQDNLLQRCFNPGTGWPDSLRNRLLYNCRNKSYYRAQFSLAPHVMTKYEKDYVKLSVYHWEELSLHIEYGD